MKIRLACAALAVLLGAGLALLHGAAGELASVRADKRVGFQKYTVARCARASHPATRSQSAPAIRAAKVPRSWCAVQRCPSLDGLLSPLSAT